MEFYLNWINTDPCLCRNNSEALDTQRWPDKEQSTDSPECMVISNHNPSYCAGFWELPNALNILAPGRIPRQRMNDLCWNLIPGCWKTHVKKKLKYTCLNQKCENSQRLMLWILEKKLPLQLTSLRYGHNAQWGRVQPHSFAVFRLAFKPGAVGIAAVSPGRQDDVFKSKLLCSISGPEPGKKPFHKSGNFTEGVTVTSKQKTKRLYGLFAALHENCRYTTTWTLVNYNEMQYNRHAVNATLAKLMSISLRNILNSGCFIYMVVFLKL